MFRWLRASALHTERDKEAKNAQKPRMEKAQVSKELTDALQNLSSLIETLRLASKASPTLHHAEVESVEKDAELAGEQPVAEMSMEPLIASKPNDLTTASLVSGDSGKQWLISLSYRPDTLDTNVTIVSLPDTDTAIEPPPEKPVTPPKVNQADRCFPPDSIVYTEAAPQGIPMSEVQLGDKLLTAERNGKLGYSSVFMWIHNSTTLMCDYLEITCGERKITLSEGHVIFRGVKCEPVPAYRLREGDLLHFCNPETKKMELKAVTGIRELTLQGVMAPLTMDGKVIVDGFLASCYGDYPDNIGIGTLDHHAITHAFFAPVRMAHRFKLRQDWLRTGIDKKTGIHKYPFWLKNNLWGIATSSLLWGNMQ